MAGRAAALGRLPWQPRPGAEPRGGWHTRGSDGRRRPNSPSPATRAGIWRCAMPMAPRQLPSLPPPNRANPPAGANSGLDKTWGQGHYPYEVRSEGEYFDEIQNVKVTKDMLDLAKHIVN
jgi:hypothetical protein